MFEHCPVLATTRSGAEITLSLRNWRQRLLPYRKPRIPSAAWLELAAEMAQAQQCAPRFRAAMRSDQCPQPRAVDIVVHIEDDFLLSVGD